MPQHARALAQPAVYRILAAAGNLCDHSLLFGIEAGVSNLNPASARLGSGTTDLRLFAADGNLCDRSLL